MLSRPVKVIVASVVTLVTVSVPLVQLAVKLSSGAVPLLCTENERVMKPTPYSTLEITGCEGAPEGADLQNAPF